MNADALSRRHYADQGDTGNDSVQISANGTASINASATAIANSQSDALGTALSDKEYVQVEFTYGSIPKVASADTPNEDTIPKADPG